jgi:hypothetical protein
MEINGEALPEPNPTPVPEPTSMLIGLLGLGSALGFRKRNKYN